MVRGLQRASASGERYNINWDSRGQPELRRDCGITVNRPYYGVTAIRLGFPLFLARRCKSFDCLGAEKRLTRLRHRNSGGFMTKPGRSR
jgi:hypothetical protein